MNATPKLFSRRRSSLISSVIAGLALVSTVSVELRAADATAKFVPVDTSRLMGSPEPLLPMRLAPAFPNLKFEKPLAFTYPPDGSNRVVVVSQSGVAYIFPNRADVKQDEVREFLDVRQKVKLTDFEEGLLGLAFHPKFKTNGEVFAFYSIKDIEPRGSAISRFRVSKTDPNRVDVSTEEELLRYSKPYGNHDGGSIEFGPDGMLYIAVGDGGLRDDPHGNGQNLETLLAKVLRIDVDRKDAGKNYAIPKDNPFVGKGEKVRGEIWAYGVRNPWRLSFDPQTGTCWIGDVGQNLYEEIDIIVRGGNYGWSLREGKHPFGPKGVEARADLIEPIWEYPRTDGRSITGGVVYRGKQLPEIEGAYIYADWVTGRMWALRWDGKKVTANQEITPSALPGITSIGYDASHEMFITAFDGRVYRLEKANWGSEAAAPPFPRKLSETGLFTSVKDMKPQPGLIPYSVNVPLWSDDAEKERYVALPKGASVKFSEGGAWDFPVGTVFVKTFSLNAPKPRRLETRLLIHHRWGWKGYTYIWNDEQTEAELADSAVTRTFDVATPTGTEKQTWYFPSRSDCNACHTPLANFVLGANTRQMNRAHSYGGSSENQVEHWAALGVFSNAPANKAGDLAAFPDWKSGSGTAEARARAYLDVNCAICHAPGATGLATINLKSETPLDRMVLLNQTPGRNRTGPEDSKLVLPGDPNRSELWHRMQNKGTSRMPPLATSKVDATAVALVGTWIAGLTADQSSPASDKFPVRWVVKDGCNAPESAYFDADSGFIFISQIAGDGGKKDGFGWISKVEPTGKIVKEKWVTGLSAPKGIRSHKGTLYVSDLDEIVAIDIAKGEIVRRVSIPGAKFLNDLACGPDGTVYVADMIGSRIYQYLDGKLSVFAEGEDLESPNGLLVDGDRLIVAGWGFTTDFTTKTPGRLFSLDLKTKKKTLITPNPTGNLDGIELDGHGGYVVTDWPAGKVLRIGADGATTTLLELAQGAADHAYLPSQSLLILPRMMENMVVAYDLSAAIAKAPEKQAAKEPSPSTVWVASEGFDKPESAYFDRESGFVFVSQISGEGAGKDGVGWISKIDMSGKVVAPKWVTGLNAPKGIRSAKGILWVSDIDELVGIEIKTGKIAQRVPVDGSKFLNDVAADSDGTLYVSDMLGNKIFRIRDGKSTVFAEGDQLEFPNGILVDKDRLIVAARGELTKDLQVVKPGHLFALDLKTAAKSLIAKDPIGVLDGLESDGAGGYVISDWMAGKILHVSPEGAVKPILELSKGTADLAYLPEKKLLLVPRMLENNLTAIDLKTLLK